MTPVTLTEYARAHGISYESVRKTVNRYQKELEGHISTQNRTKYLDEEAQKILDEKRRVNPIVILEESANSEIKQLEDQLREKDEEIKQLQKMIMDMKDKEIALIEYKAQAQVRLEDKERVEADLRSKDQELVDTKVKLAESETELKSFRKSIFGFYRKA